MADEIKTTQDAPGAAPEPVETVNKFFDLPKPGEAEGGAAAPAQETPPAAAPAQETPPADERLTRSYEDLMRRDRELQARQERLRADEQDLRRWRALREKAKADPGAALRELEIDPFSLSDRLLGIEPAEKAKAPEKETLTRAEAEQLVQQQIAHQQQVWHHQQQIGQMISGSDHDLLKAKIQQDPTLVGAVYNEAVRRYQDSGTLPDIPSILAELEQREEAAIYAALDKLMTVGKIKDRYGKPSSGKETLQAPPKTPASAAATSRTLSATQKEEPAREERPMTKEERWAEFHRAIKDGPPKDWRD